MEPILYAYTVERQLSRPLIIRIRFFRGENHKRFFTLNDL